MREGVLASCALVVGALVVALAASAADAGGGRSAIDPTRLPIGDGKVTTSGPRRGYVYACPGPAAPAGGGAQVEGPWIRGDGTFDLTAKAKVDGSVRWPKARFRNRVRGVRRLIAGNGLPKGETTGRFPIRPEDDAYVYDRNPNSIRSQRVRYALRDDPRRARGATCLSGGPIGIARDGVAIFDALDAEDRDAVAHEVQDGCGGHPQRTGLYHYHAIPSCLTDRESTRRPSGLVGFALDGFPIYGPRGAGGRLLTNADLDACHGRTSRVRLEGRRQRIYHYNATFEYPYTLGCFRGRPVSAGLGG